MKNIKEYIDKLQNGLICQYLNMNNWHEVETLFNDKVRQFVTPNDDDAILIPMSKEFRDYYRVMLDSISTIANIENDTIKGLMNKLINPAADILKWRISDDETSLGVIPFSSMSNNIDYIKDLLSSACLDILSPSIFHKKVATKDVQEQMAMYKFGQTEIGSYILNIVCPLGYYQYQLFEPQVEDLPLSRRINLNIINNISVIQDSIIEHNSMFKDTVAEGKLSVNFLNALLDLYEENKDADFTISAKWDSSVPNPSTDIISCVALRPRCMDKVAEIAEEFTPSEPQNVEKTFYGKIINIGGEAEVDNRVDISVTIATIGEGGKSLKVKAILNNNDYYAIVDSAFQNGLDVKVSGILTSTMRSICLTPATIEVLPL